MSKKDYELIAAVLFKSCRYLSETNAANLRLMFVDALKNDNPNFKPDKFIKASTGTVRAAP